ncbi:MAG: pyridoxine 5'-phosphate synthase [Candidatus Omnitrophica bacterium]|nr:pyridoxine 5'-phosphate synthase [Candidatus Omnitrophota bacterium]
MPNLGVNIDHVATLRQARRGHDPEPVIAASICEAAGADSIVIHLREDRRHIQDADLSNLRKTIKTRLNLEMSVAPAIVAIACKVKPDQATLVPEKRQELTTEGGLDVVKNFTKVKEAVKRLQNAGIEVSLFIDPDKKQIESAKKSGAGMIELHTGRYADAKNKAEVNKNFMELENAVRRALNLGLRVNAGHGLDYNNVSRVAKIRGVEELNIGYSIICRSVFVGLDRAIREMKVLI